MNIFDINPDIRRAETIPADFYTDERYFHASKEKIFARSWQFLGADDAAKALQPRMILEDFLSEPVLVSRDKTDLHCFSNVCTHRGNILIENDCADGGIRCAYHGRRFDLSGKFLSMPEFETAENFPTKRDDLPEIPFAIWEKFLFASVNPYAPFDEFVSEMRNKLSWLDFDNLKFTAAKDYLVKAHWALYCENYLEGFHVPFVHPSLNQAIDYGSYTTDLFPFSSLQTALTKDERDAFDFSSNARVAAFYFFIFPNLMFNFYPWGLSVNVVKPLKIDLTKVSYLTFVSDESKLNGGAGANLETVELEDQKVVENVQRGIRSRLYSTGRYSPAREQGTHHFHQLIAKFMREDSIINE